MYLEGYANAISKILGNHNTGGFTTISFTGKTLKFNFKDRDYTPIEIHVASNEDITNLNTIFNYLLNGATVSSKLHTDPEVDEEYEMDMSFEDKEKIYVFDLDDFTNEEQSTDGWEELEKDPYINPYLTNIFTDAKTVFNTTFQINGTKELYADKTYTYGNNVVVRYRFTEVPSGEIIITVQED